jgi:hypothetical protein
VNFSRTTPWLVLFGVGRRVSRFILKKAAPERRNPKQPSDQPSRWRVPFFSLPDNARYRRALRSAHPLLRKKDFSLASRARNDRMTRFSAAR